MNLWEILLGIAMILDKIVGFFRAIFKPQKEENLVITKRDDSE
jgi:hypothetical protein